MKKVKKQEITNVVVEAVRKGVTSFWKTPLPKPTKLKITKVTSAITGKEINIKKRK